MDMITIMDFKQRKSVSTTVKQQYQKAVQDDAFQKGDKHFQHFKAYNTLLLQSNIDPYYDLKKNRRDRILKNAKKSNVFVRLSQK